MTPFPPALIFDMDGTLLDNMPYHILVWSAYLAELGAPVDPLAFHEQTAGKTNPEILRLFLGEDLSAEQAAAYADEKERRYRALYADEAIQPLPGLADFLAQAREQGARLALATSAGRENIAFVLGRLGLSGIFDAVVSAEDVTRGKPDPEAFLLAAQRLGMDPRGCLVFEDSVKGIQAAHAAGMRVVAVLTALGEDEARAMPGVVVTIRDYVGFQPPDGIAR